MCKIALNEERRSFRKLFIFLRKNLLKVLSWGFGIMSAWMWVAEYQWEKQKIFSIDWGILSVVIPIVIAGVLQAIHCYLEERKKPSLQELETSLKDFDSIKKAIPSIIYNLIVAIYENLNLTENDRITLNSQGGRKWKSQEICWPEHWVLWGSWSAGPRLWRRIVPCRSKEKKTRSHSILAIQANKVYIGDKAFYIGHSIKKQSSSRD